MPYRKKHFLETSDQEREFRRDMEMRRNGRDAIENYYPEVAMLPASRAPNVMRSGGVINKIRQDSAINDAKEAANKIKYDTLLRQFIAEKPEEEKGYKRGGVVRGDGIAKRGKTRGKFV